MKIAFKNWKIGIMSDKTFIYRKLKTEFVDNQVSPLKTFTSFSFVRWMKRDIENIKLLKCSLMGIRDLNCESRYRSKNSSLLKTKPPNKRSNFQITLVNLFLNYFSAIPIKNAKLSVSWKTHCEVFNFPLFIIHPSFK